MESHRHQSIGENQLVDHFWGIFDVSGMRAGRRVKKRERRKEENSVNQACQSR
jgi:hypothetical protein